MGDQEAVATRLAALLQRRVVPTTIGASLALFSLRAHRPRTSTRGRHTTTPVPRGVRGAVDPPRRPPPPRRGASDDRIDLAPDCVPRGSDQHPPPPGRTPASPASPMHGAGTGRPCGRRRPAGHCGGRPGSAGWCAGTTPPPFVTSARSAASPSSRERLLPAGPLPWRWTSGAGCCTMTPPDRTPSPRPPG